MDSKQTNETPTKYLANKWIVFASANIMVLLLNSLVQAFGTLFPYILTEFGENRTITATIQSVFFGVGLCSGVFVGIIAQHYGPLICGTTGTIFFSSGLLLSSFAQTPLFLILSFGLVSGLGLSFLELSINQVASQCFQGRTRLVALSVVNSAAGVGAMGYPYLIAWLADTFGLGGAFLLLSGITIHGVPMALLWVQVNRTRSTETRTSRAKHIAKQSLKDLFANVKGTIRHKPFQAVLLGFGLALQSINLFQILIFDILESNGLEQNQSLIAVMVLNAVSVLGRLIPGFFKHIHGLSTTTAPLIGTLGSGIGILIMTLSKDFTGNTIACAVLGLSKGILFASVPVVMLDMLETFRFSIGLGIVFCLTGLLTAEVGPLNGFLRDVSGSYVISLYVAIGVVVLAMILFLVSMWLDRRVIAEQELKLFLSVFSVTPL